MNIKLIQTIPQASGAPQKTAKAIKIGPIGTEEYSGSGFKDLSFSSKHRQKNSKGYLMPDHFEGITGVPTRLTTGKSTKF